MSVRDSHEARQARRRGVDWVDLKDPNNGSLGAADEATAAAVARELQQSSDSANPSHRVQSAAVGELRDMPTLAAKSLACYFPLLKVGLSGLCERQDWPQQLAEFSKMVELAGARLVPVIYADHVACHAPDPAQVIEVAASLHEQPAVPRADSSYALASSSDDIAAPLGMPRYLLIDTFTKDGRRLLDWMELAELESIVHQAAASGRQTVVAGSLALLDIPQLMSLPIAAIAVRGAVCVGDRRSGLCPEKLRHWVELFSAR